MAKLSPEREAEIKAILDETLGPLPMPRSKVVARDGEVIRDADVEVSKADVNFPSMVDGSIAVRRPEWVTVNMEAYEQQRAERAEARRARRALDPFRLGHWGPTDDDWSA